MELVINDMSYPLIAAVPTSAGAEFDFRSAYLLSLRMGWREAHELFINGLKWSISIGNVIQDKSEFDVAGQMIDYRDGRVDVYMMEKTEAEKIKEEEERIRPIIQELLPHLPDDRAMEMVDYFDDWHEDTEYAEGDRFRYLGILYKARSSFTSAAHFPPETTPTLYVRVGEPEEGVEDLPIPYEPNMELEEGKYYEQFGIVYYCNRSTGVPVYNNLADLLNIYVVLAE